MHIYISLITQNKWQRLLVVLYEADYKIETDLHNAVSVEKKERTASEQSITQSIMKTAIKAIKAAMMAVEETANLVNNASQYIQHQDWEVLTLKWPTSDWKATDKYH